MPCKILLTVLGLLIGLAVQFSLEGFVGNKGNASAGNGVENDDIGDIGKVMLNSAVETCIVLVER